MADSQSATTLPVILSPCSSGRRSSCGSKSPEFEFWMFGNRIDFPQPNVLSADELFSGGFILPLRFLESFNDLPKAPSAEVTEDCKGTLLARAPETERSTVDDFTASSQRWRRVFHKIRDKRGLDSPGGDGGEGRSSKEKDLGGGVKEKKRDQKKVNGGIAAELNINIWPFSRSRSAGNGGNRPRPAANRKVSSAPCSRSNSTGKSMPRKWPPNSPSRGGGVHLGRTSPVWQIRRGGVGGRGVGRRMSDEKGETEDGDNTRRKLQAPPSRGGGGSKGRVLSLNVPMCIGYRHNLSCKREANSAANVSTDAGAVGGRSGKGGGELGGEGARRGHLFNIKSLFSRKVN